MSLLAMLFGGRLYMSRNGEAGGGGQVGPPERCKQHFLDLAVESPWFYLVCHFCGFYIIRL